MRKLVLVIGWVGLLGCTYGGSDEDPRRGVVSEPVEAQDTDGTYGRVQETPTPSDRGSDASGQEENEPEAAGIDNGSCEPTTPVASCDPVHNDGCLLTLLFGLPTQCDIDPHATTPTGRCVLSGIRLDATCSSDDVSTTCSARSTCVSGTCRKMCFCDDDCDPGEACTDATAPGPAGPIRLCQAK